MQRNYELKKFKPDESIFEDKHLDLTVKESIYIKYNLSLVLVSLRSIYKWMIYKLQEWGNNKAYFCIFYAYIMYLFIRNI